MNSASAPPLLSEEMYVPKVYDQPTVTTTSVGDDLNVLKNKLQVCYNDNKLLVTVLVLIIIFLLFNLVNTEESMFSNLKSKFTSGMSRAATRGPRVR